MELMCLGRRASVRIKGRVGSSAALDCAAVALAMVNCEFVIARSAGKGSAAVSVWVGRGRGRG